MTAKIGTRIVHSFASIAISYIESDSIRLWAQSAHNFPIILTMAKETLTRNSKADPKQFATYLTMVAMGM